MGYGIYKIQSLFKSDFTRSMRCSHTQELNNNYDAETIK